MNNRNFQKEMENIIAENKERGIRPSLLLHACCAPCASACLMRLLEAFKITVFYYNPNITDKDEYEKRVAETKRLILLINEEYSTDIDFAEGEYEPDRFFEMAKGLENEPEQGGRCRKCYRLREEITAKLAKDKGYDYFATTLTLSPLKNAAALNEIGEELAKQYDISYLPSDFKKKDGYKLSIELSKKYGLYRQNYCGCVFSSTNEQI